MTTDPFSLLDDTLFAFAPTRAPIVVTPRGGSALPAVTAIVEDIDEQADAGGQAVEQNVLTFRVRRSELPQQPLEGWTIAHAGRDWRVIGPAVTEARGALWEILAARKRLP